MKKGDLVQFKDKRPGIHTGLSHENLYEYVDNCSIKDPILHNWVSGVIYRDINTGKLYVRDLENFNSKFEKAEC